MNRYRLGIALALITLGISMRLLPHPANFAPMTAIALFGGAVLPRRSAVAVPLVAIVVSDSLIGWYAIMPAVWICYGLIALASSKWLRAHVMTRGFQFTIASSIFFFVFTNFAVWVGGGLYPHTWAGLTQCFTLALPFFRNTAFSDLIYAAGLFGVYAAAMGATSKFHRVRHEGSL